MIPQAILSVLNNITILQEQTEYDNWCESVQEYADDYALLTKEEVIEELTSHVMTHAFSTMISIRYLEETDVEDMTDESFDAYAADFIRENLTTIFPTLKNLTS